MLDKHIVVFSNLPRGLPLDHGFDHIIEHMDGNSVVMNPYRHPKWFKDEIERTIQELFGAGHIRPSSSHFTSFFILVNRKDSTMRMCINYHALNKNTIKNKYPIMCIDELMDELYGVVYFSKIDFHSRYHHIRIWD